MENVFVLIHLYHVCGIEKFALTPHYLTSKAFIFYFHSQCGDSLLFPWIIFGCAVTFSYHYSQLKVYGGTEINLWNDHKLLTACLSKTFITESCCCVRWLLLCKDIDLKQLQHRFSHAFLTHFKSENLSRQAVIVVKSGILDLCMGKHHIPRLYQLCTAPGCQRKYLLPCGGSVTSDRDSLWDLTGRQQ